MLSMVNTFLCTQVDSPVPYVTTSTTQEGIQYKFSSSILHLGWQQIFGHLLGWALPEVVTPTTSNPAESTKTQVQPLPKPTRFDSSFYKKQSEAQHRTKEGPFLGHREIKLRRWRNPAQVRHRVWIRMCNRALGHVIVYTIGYAIGHAIGYTLGMH